MIKTQNFRNKSSLTSFSFVGKFLQKITHLGGQAAVTKVGVAALGILLWATIGHTALGQNVNISKPIGQTTKAKSVSVTRASDESPVPVTISGSTATTTDVKSAAKEASKVLKSSAGSLVMAAGSSDTDQWILIMNAASLPANGAVVLLYPPIHVAAGGNFHVLFNPPLAASTGIVICNSNANSFTKTIGAADCIFSSQVQ